MDVIDLDGELTGHGMTSDDYRDLGADLIELAGEMDNETEEYK